MSVTMAERGKEGWKKRSRKRASRQVGRGVPRRAAVQKRTAAPKRGGQNLPDRGIKNPRAGNGAGPVLSFRPVQRFRAPLSPDDLPSFALPSHAPSR